ncbi:MAG: HAD hydrolase-like protein [Verrucomicrobiales bacterium]|nr:HAD hydrolase-like protein [Verrucomicrobiales bacterium]
MKPPLLFDLDGTITDPRPGFIASVHYALRALDEPIPEENDLLPFIGPPLRGTFEILLRTTERDTIERAVSLYRERLYDGGMFEAEVYPRMRELLTELADEGYRLFVATGKPEGCAEQIIEHFGFSPLFEKVRGALPDGQFCDKAELVSDLYQQNGLTPGHGIMIGDTHFDIRAGRLNGLQTIAVDWGYGSVEEMKDGGCDHFVKTADKLGQTIRSVPQPVTK